MTLLLEDKLTKIKDALNLHQEVGYCLDYDDNYEVIEIVNDNLNKANIQYCNVDTGVSKIVVIPENCSYVLKTPLFGAIYYPEEYDEENSEYYINYDDPKFEYYEGAYYKDAELDYSNYCELEEYLYGFAVDCGVEEMFAKTEFFGWAKYNRPVYISEKCIPYDYGEKTPTENSRSLVKENREKRTPGWWRMDSVVTALFIDDYGIEKANKLFQFLNDYEIDDLHTGNVMISEKTGKIVITDYSGFNH